ncbi:tyrosine-type recombinase/integrase [Streptomyces pseudogriseolus]|uniref:Site-specific recombinase XerD n=1 Tax=Streptomyces gancidicus BKS 13-15 TaxID=1284664 RepID=M3ECL0_STREZ|nr:site-specific integrase [Streptomyces gancidicus]EMF30821.1 site-specific recombinase XerD [Streptomyces gancidicus BKS 13-15]
MPTVVQLPAGKSLTVRAAADAFLDSLRSPNTVRSYGVGVGKTAERLGEARPLGSVADDEIGEALELLWGTAAVNTWNARRAAVLSWLGWCASYGYDGPAVPAWTKRLAVPDSETPARSKMAVDRLIARREVHLREKTLWRMLYETAGRSEEILGVNIEDLDLAARRCPVKAKGARSKARRRGQAREDFVLETVYWDAGTARLLPRLLRGRTRGPVFVTHRRPGPGKVIAPRDVCPDTGLARLSYGQARALLDEHTAVRGPGTGWDLHEYRHSALTHLGEQAASLLMLMAKSRHKKPENVRRYFKPSPEAIAELTSLLAPGDVRR